jgi:hypothetical protein
MSSSPISASYLERKLRAAVGVQGANPLPDLEDVKRGLLVLENDRPEWCLAGGEQLFGGVVNQPLVAANVSAAQLNNPAGSGVILVVRRVITTQSAAGGVSLKIGLTTANLATAFNTKSVIDTRLRNAGTQTNSAALMFGQATTPGDPTGGQHIAQALVGVNSPFEYKEPIILGPDSSLYVVCGVVNQTLIANFVWRERPIESAVEVK